MWKKTVYKWIMPFRHGLKKKSGPMYLYLIMVGLIIISTALSFFVLEHKPGKEKISYEILGKTGNDFTREISAFNQLFEVRNIINLALQKDTLTHQDTILLDNAFKRMDQIERLLLIKDISKKDSLPNK